MNEAFDTPIFIRIYKLYEEIYNLRKIISKCDRYSIWLKVENICLEILEDILKAINSPRSEKYETLCKANEELNILRIFIRLSKDIKAIDNKKYITLEEKIDEIGRMLGGWTKSVKPLN